MRLNILLALTAVAGLTACAQAATPAPKTDEEKALYSLGVATGRDLQGFSLTDPELEMVKAGFSDGVRDAGKLKTDEMNAVLPKLQELYKTRMEANAKREKMLARPTLPRPPPRRARPRRHRAWCIAN